MEIKQISQVKAAQEIGVSPEHLNGVLRKRLRPSVGLAQKIEKVMGIPWQSFFSESPSSHPAPATPPTAPVVGGGGEFQQQRGGEAA